MSTATKTPKFGQHLPELGGTYVGIASDLPGGDARHLILLDAKPTSSLTWANAKKWVAKQGDEARLPTRAEALLIFANAKNCVTPNWHWTCEQFDASYAWSCYFSYGGLDNYRKGYEGSVVAVRRLPLQFFNTFEGGAA